MCETAHPRDTEGATSMQVDRSPVDVAWAAGLFEGEGSLIVRGRTSAEAILGMTDADVVARFAAVLGFGTLHHEQRDNPRHNDVYRWSASNARDVRVLAEMFLPFFGGRRRQRALEILEYTQNCPGPHRAQIACRQGHPYDETTYTVPGTTHRKCRICQRESDLAYRRTHREKLRLKSAAWRAEHPEETRTSKRASYQRRKGVANG